MTIALSRSLILFLWGATVFIVLANKAAELYQIPTRDSALFAYFGQRILEGQLPYRDIYDNKPPGIYYTNALIFALLPHKGISLHLFEALYAVLTLFAFFWCARTFFGKAGATWATFLFGMFSTLPLVNEGGNFTETYLLLPLVVFYGCAARYLRSGDRGWLVAAGVLGGAAILYNLKAFLDLAVLAALLLGVAWRRNPFPIRLIASYGALSFGWLAVVAPVLAFLWSHGAVGEMIRQTFLFNAHYIGYANANLFFLNLVLAALALLAGMAVLWVLAALGLVSLLHPPGQHPGLLLVLGWLAADAYGAFLGGRFYHHYFLPLVPPLALLGTHGFQALLMQANVWGHFVVLKWRARVLLVLVIAFTFHPFLSQTVAGAQALQAGPRIGDTAQEQVARLIQGETEAEHYIFVWWYEPTIYFLAQRRSPSRVMDFFHPAVWLTDDDRTALFQELMDDLRAKPPHFIVFPPVLQGPYQDQVPEMPEWMVSRYTLYRIVDGWQVFRAIGSSA